MPSDAQKRDDPLEGALACVQGLLESSRAGDIERYLAAFSGAVRERLAREVAEQGRDSFANALLTAAQARKSHALFAPEADGPDAALVLVESVFADRNERQTYRLARGSDGWRIVGIDLVREQVPKAKFGTPATFQEPEGPPVPNPPLTVETP
jgi:hypothetical protein